MTMPRGTPVVTWHKWNVLMKVYEKVIGEVHCLTTIVELQAIVDTVENVVARYMRQVQLSAT